MKINVNKQNFKNQRRETMIKLIMIKCNSIDILSGSLSWQLNSKYSLNIHCSSQMEMLCRNDSEVSVDAQQMLSNLSTDFSLQLCSAMVNHVSDKGNIRSSMFVWTMRFSFSWHC